VILKFQQHILENRLFKNDDRILLAVSGGIDSMVMLHLFRSLNFSIGVAHCNFQLRGDESDQDESFVRQKCLNDQIPFYSIRFDTNNYAIEKGISIQMAARELRYNWFNQLLEREGYQKIATAHHLNDSLETSLLNLSRGTGISGVMGISAENGNKVRPMLSFTRKEIETYAMMNEISWREDRSNQASDYQRNFIRHEVIPKLRELNPSIENAFSDFVSRMRGSEELLLIGAQVWKEKFWSGDESIIRIRKEGFDNVHHAPSVLYEMIRKFGFNMAQCHEIIEARNGQSGKVFQSATHTLVIDREELVLSLRFIESQSITIHEGDSLITRDEESLEISISDSATTQSNADTVIFDLDKIKFPLTWRSWKPGDHFHPLGMQHRKKLSDFFIDRKISRIEKERASVIESGGDIVWVVGYRLDDRYTTTEATKKFLCVKRKHVV
jgi:tRNA(Ile)-lysidine synthetase, N-terminal domain/tRNA(Ile)-lysidine synthetase, C-terminal domain